ncbi:MAG: PadR family transcriptional regulator [Actinobacteria bacterium]|nr:PadR family transcriptional regulator [Actinomycetota bacterium]
MFRERMKGNLDLLILAVLAAAPAHGYEVAERLRQRSNGTFDLPEGTIYPALHRLEARGWVTSSWRSVGGRNRRVYELTDDGHQQLVAERTDWATFIAGVAAVLGVEPA